MDWFGSAEGRPKSHPSASKIVFETQRKMHAMSELICYATWSQHGLNKLAAQNDAKSVQNRCHRFVMILDRFLIDFRAPRAHFVLRAGPVFLVPVALQGPFCFPPRARFVLLAPIALPRFVLCCSRAKLCFPPRAKFVSTGVHFVLCLSCFVFTPGPFSFA